MNAYAVRMAVARRDGAAFWAVAFAFLIVMAFATLPSPLCGLYRVRDHLSTLTVTVVYAVFAGGTIAALILERVVVARVGRRGAMLGAVATMIVSAALLVAWKTLPGLLVGRVLTGVSVGLATGTATTYLIELRLRDDPNSSVVGARTIGTSVNVGALGVGPLVAGILAQWTGRPLSLPYVVFIALGMTSMVVGLALLVTAVRLSTPSLPLFLVGGALIGAGAGLVFKGTTGIVLEAAAPEDRVAMTWRRDRKAVGPLRAIRLRPFCWAFQPCRLLVGRLSDERSDFAIEQGRRADRRCTAAPSRGRRG